MLRQAAALRQQASSRSLGSSCMDGRFLGQLCWLRGNLRLIQARAMAVADDSAASAAPCTCRRTQSGVGARTL